jgi:hypothetical protein
MANRFKIGVQKEPILPLQGFEKVFDNGILIFLKV